MIKEFCAENFTHIPAAISAGATRIELCDNLTVGGTTVSLGVMTETLDYCHEHHVSVMAIIRPRGGDFFYNDTELKMMEIDILEAKKVGVDGIVIGCLTKDQSEVDIEAMDALLHHAEGLQVTFHMAFDALSLEAQYEAIDYLADRGVTRILTHGGASGTPIQENFERLEQLITYANNRLIILPGGGITHENVEEVLSRLNVQEVHGTKIVAL